MRKVFFLTAAVSEVAAAAEFYNSQQETLGKRFVGAIEDGVSRVKFDPFLYPVIDENVRRCLVRTFPFCILFRVGKGRIVIVAVMHLHRKPGYWKKREK